MSFSSHRRKALDPELLLTQRMSHLRSCAMLIGQKYKIPRSEIIKLVQQLCGANLNMPASSTSITEAIRILDLLKTQGLENVRVSEIKS